MPEITPTSLAVTVVPRTYKIIKSGLGVFERGESLLQNGILHLVKPIVINRVTKFHTGL